MDNQHIGAQNTDESAIKPDLSGTPLVNSGNNQWQSTSQADYIPVQNSYKPEQKRNGYYSSNTYIPAPPQSAHSIDSVVSELKKQKGIMIAALIINAMLLIVFAAITTVMFVRLDMVTEEMASDLADCEESICKQGRTVSAISNGMETVVDYINDDYSYSDPYYYEDPYSLYPYVQEDKPVIYLYPEKETDVEVRLTLNDGEMLCTYPDPLEDGDEYVWNMHALPDGTLYDAEGTEYSYIFWEASSYAEPDFSQGFCVKGEDTAEFLRTTLAEIGLTPDEYNEFIVYWLPKMQDNEYNLISFQTDNYTESCPLEIIASDGEKADVLRVMMAWQAVDEYVEIEPQCFDGFERTGFSVVEWGGEEVK